MNPYYNLPPDQREAQRVVDLFNRDEALWRSLEKRRRLLRKLLKKLGTKRHKALDKLEFAVFRPPDDCVRKALTHTGH